jgi:CheY-like chemotaxis protein
MTLSTVPYAIVVEDDPIIMMETTYILEDAGFRVHESFDGDEAVLLLDTHWESTVLLFSDVDMPGRCCQSNANRSPHDAVRPLSAAA